MKREYMRFGDLVGLLNRLPAGYYNLYYWEGPGTTDYRVLTAEQDQEVRMYAARHDNVFARWAVEEVSQLVVR